MLENDDDVDISVISVQSSMSIMPGGFSGFAGASGRGPGSMEIPFGDKRKGAHSLFH